MKVVIALDKFKGTLDAPAACEIVRGALLAGGRAGLEIVAKPMADGGDGTARAMIAARGGEWIPATVSDPLGREVAAGYGWFESDQTAVVEMAAASGLALLKQDELDPLRATTFGTGELIRLATKRGARKIWLGVGGSATVDGGVGAAMALGWKFLDADGKPIGLGGGELERIRRIEVSPLVGRDRRARRTDGPPSVLSLPDIEVLCDVDNPLCGEHGAARVFGPQKGATPAMVERLDAGLAHLAKTVREELGREVADVPGAGAAGGLAAGAIAFFGARLVPGIDTVMEVCGLAEAVTGAEWVITGEGKFDEQSLRGKVVSGVTKLAREHGAKVAVIAGKVDVSELVCQREGIELAVATMQPGMELDFALANAASLLESAARDLAGKILA